MTTPREPPPVSGARPAPEPAGDIWHLRIDQEGDGSGRLAGGAWRVSTFADDEWKVISRHPTEESARAAVASLESTGNDRWG